MPSDKKILEPRCMPKHGSIEYRMSPAVTNRGELIPCCWCDQQRALKPVSYTHLRAHET